MESGKLAGLVVILYNPRRCKNLATLAQLVEQIIRNYQVVGSSPTGGS